MSLLFVACKKKKAKKSGRTKKKSAPISSQVPTTGSRATCSGVWARLPARKEPGAGEVSEII
jgi:hypothetical protein